MISINTILVGFDDESLLQVRHEILNNDWTIEAEFPSVEVVLGRAGGLYDRKKLFIVLVENQDDLSQIRLLSGRFIGFPILAVTKNIDPQALFDLMRAGATQIISLPLQPEDFKSALMQISIQFAHPTTSSQGIAVAGVRGGCGTTTLASNLAYEIALVYELDCILIDLSIHLGQVAFCLNTDPKFSFGDAASPDEKPDIHLVRQVLHKVTDHFSLIAGPHDEINREACSLDDALRVVDLCRNLSDVIILDVPCTYDSFYFETLQAADKVVLIAEQNVSSARALTLVWDQLKRERRPDTMFAVFNQFDPQKVGFDAKKLASLFNVSKVYTVSMDPKLQTEADSGGPIRFRIPRSPILKELNQLASGLLGLDATQEPGQKVSGFLKKIGIG